MKKWFNANYLYVLGAFAGGLAGFLYWNFVGCLSGTCAITSDPINSTLYGSVLGGLFFGQFKSTKSKNPATIN